MVQSLFKNILFISIAYHSILFVENMENYLSWNDIICSQYSRAGLRFPSDLMDEAAPPKKHGQN
jgi:hypothetical protein